MLARSIISVITILALGTATASAQNFWLPTKQIKGIDELPLSSNPAVVAGDTAVYALNAEGIFKSTDHGSSWILLSPTLRDEGTGLKHMIKAQNGTLVATLLGLDGTIYSANGGVTWETSSGMPFYLAQHLALHPEGALFASVREKGVMRSVDHGKSWSEMNSGLPEGFWGEGLIALANGDLLVGTGFNGNFGVYRSSNKGVSWAEVPNMNTTLVQTFAQDQLGRIYAGTSDHGVYVSNDNGASWSLTDTTGIGYASVESIAIGNDTSVFISTEGRGVFRSKDAQTWSYTGDGSGGNINQIAVAMDGFVYAGVQGNVVRSKESTGSIIPGGGGQGGVKLIRESSITVSMDITSGSLVISGLDAKAPYTISDILGREIRVGSLQDGSISVIGLMSGTYVLMLDGHSFLFTK